MFYTLDDILNPKGLAMGNKGMILNAYERRYNVIRERILWACAPLETSFLFHVRIPSENPLCPNIWYDIVFELYPTRKEDINDGTMKNYGIRVFSNYPIFMFTFTYVYNKYELLIPWLKGKCSHQALFNPPIKTNPQQLVSSDIKLWFAAYHIKRLGLQDKRKFQVATNTTAQHIGQIVIGQEVMLKLRTQTEATNKENLRRQQKRKQKNDNRKKDYATQKTIEDNVAQYARATGQHVGSAHQVAKTAVKVARSPRTARQLRRAKLPKKSR
jgi:hypothetical protein